MIKLFTYCIREYKKPAILTPTFITLEVICEVIIPLLMVRMIDKGIDVGNMSVILQTGGLLIVIATLSLFFGAKAASYSAIASTGYARNLRHDLFYRVQNFSFSNIDKFSTAGIVTRLTTDVTNVQMAFMMLIRFAVRCLTMLIFSLIMAFSINVRLSLIFLAAIPFLGLGLFIIMRRAFPLFEKVFKNYDQLNMVVQENLHGIRVVKNFVREDREIEKFSVVSNAIFRLFSRAERTLAFNMPLMQITIYTCMLLICWMGARLIVSSTMTTGELISLMTYAIQILMSLMFISMVFVMITISRASRHRISELLNEQPDLSSPTPARQEVTDGSVEFRNVSFSYAGPDGNPCLSNINLSFKSGQTIGVIGGTGSSKTSLVQLIPRLYDATCGSVLVGGHDVREYDLHTLRNSVAMVLQKNVLFSGTIKENLRWGNPDATDQELIRVCELAHADDFINNFPNGYDSYIEQSGTNVSGGQKQRLCIARALLKNPKILILDDSTSAVDTATDAAIRRAFWENIPHVTKFIIAQRISSVQDADQIIVLDGGRIHDVGTHDELLSRDPIYQEVYQSQMKGDDADEK